NKHTTGSSGGELGELFSSKKWIGSKKISLAIDLLYLWIWGLLGCRGSIKTQRQRYIRNDVMLAGSQLLLAAQVNYGKTFIVTLRYFFLNYGSGLHLSIGFLYDF
ncbi:hypothetical protein ACJX0J_039727, partial [Zea mays]